MRVICFYCRKNSNTNYGWRSVLKRRRVNKCHYNCYIRISSSASFKGFIGETLNNMWRFKRGSEHRWALCCWILIVTATPATVAETNLCLSEYNARLTQIGPITLTIRPLCSETGSPVLQPLTTTLRMTDKQKTRRTWKWCRGCHGI